MTNENSALVASNSPASLARVRYLSVMKSQKIDKIDLFNLIAESKAIGDLRNDNEGKAVIEVVGIFQNPTEIEDKETGEMKETFATVLIDKSGASFHSVSPVVNERISMLLSPDFFGPPSTWSHPVKLQFTLKSKGDKSLNIVKVVK